MTTADWITLALTVAGVSGLLLGSRYLKPRIKVPAISPWLAMGVYNGIWAVILLAERFTALSLPGFILPVGVVGGNGVLVNLFGLPTLPRRQKKKGSTASSRGGRGQGSQGGRDPERDPDREPLIPKSKKKRRHKRR